jgi:[NiFe] hydrogenase assembly HybE family chaperone
MLEALERGALDPAAQARVDALEALFGHIARVRMAGIPILHPRLRVQAVGFEPVDDGAALAGVLVTPWFMNLLWVPLRAEPAASAVGSTRQRRVGRESFPFIAAHEDGFGAYEACSLFSPMGEFRDHEAAVATARAVLDELRRPEPPVLPRPSVTVPSRRALLFGRGSATPVDANLERMGRP